MQAMRALLLTTIGLLVAQAASGTEQATLPQPFSMAYYESWEEIPVALGSATRLAMTPDHVDDGVDHGSSHRIGNRGDHRRARVVSDMPAISLFFEQIGMHVGVLIDAKR